MEWARPRIHLRPIMRAIMVLDAVSALIGGVVGTLLRFGQPFPDRPGMSAPVVAAGLPVLWLVTIAAAGGYDRRYLVAGADQFRRVLNGGVWLLGLIAFASYVARADFSRGFVAIAVPLTVLMTVLMRYITRKRVHHRLAKGATIHRALVVGDQDETDSVVRHIERNRHIGFNAVAFGRPGTRLLVEHRSGLHSLDFEPHDIYGAARWVGADTIVIAGLHLFPRGELRRLAWRLEGKGVDLVVAPALTDVAGPRLLMRPVDGLPLLHLEEPRFRGPARIVKGVFDRALAALLLLLLSPLMLGIMLILPFTSGRPILYRQKRIGRRGRPFLMWKFRTMHVGSDKARDLLDHMNEHDGVLFKIRRDPRITGMGRWLRRTSLDELPQLWNVIGGSMSLVGPRPPLEEEVVRYGADVRRRLLVKPGITGLWQISGRADLSWEDSVRLDLYYVENWSVALDLQVLWKTAGAVARGQGAY